MCRSWDIELDSLYVVSIEKFQSHNVNLTLIGLCPKSKLIQAISIYYNMFKFQVDWTIIFLVYTDRHQDRQTGRHTHTQTDMSTL